VAGRGDTCIIAEIASPPSVCACGSDWLARLAMTGDHYPRSMKCERLLRLVTQFLASMELSNAYANGA